MIGKRMFAAGLLGLAINAGFATAAAPANEAMDLSNRVRHEIALLPYTGIWDWIEAEVRTDGTVVLKGDVTQPTSKSDAEFRVRRLEGIPKVVNEIRVLPLSRFDDEVRVAVYRSLFNPNSTLSGYALGANPSIHIIVDHGKVTLKGVVSSPMDRQIASVRAKGVSGVFAVDNQLKLESEL